MWAHVGQWGLCVCTNARVGYMETWELVRKVWKEGRMGTLQQGWGGDDTFLNIPFCIVLRLRTIGIFYMHFTYSKN